MVVPQSPPDRPGMTWSEACRLLTHPFVLQDQIQVPDKRGRSNKSPFARLFSDFHQLTSSSQAAQIFTQKPRALKKQLFRTEKEKKKNPIQKNTARHIHTTNTS